jgi:hypothetical protein
MVSRIISVEFFNESDSFRKIYREFVVDNSIASFGHGIGKDSFERREVCNIGCV